MYPVHAKKERKREKERRRKNSVRRRDVFTTNK
jgi:hypothetical protein